MLKPVVVVLVLVRDPLLSLCCEVMSVHRQRPSQYRSRVLRAFYRRVGLLVQSAARSTPATPRRSA
jgi:hypothetical protein